MRKSVKQVSELLRFTRDVPTREAIEKLYDKKLLDIHIWWDDGGVVVWYIPWEKVKSKTFRKTKEKITLYKGDCDFLKVTIEAPYYNYPQSYLIDKSCDYLQERLRKIFKTDKDIEI